LLKYVILLKSGYPILDRHQQSIHVNLKPENTKLIN